MFKVKINEFHLLAYYAFKFLSSSASFFVFSSNSSVVFFASMIFYLSSVISLGNWVSISSSSCFTYFRFCSSSFFFFCSYS